MAQKPVFGGENHPIDKHLTKETKSVKISLQSRNRRFVRNTTGFSKKPEIHNTMMAIMIHQRNYKFHTL